MLRIVARALAACWLSEDPVLYRPLSPVERARLNLVATVRALRSREGRLVGLCLVLWVLLGFHVVWWFDVRSVWRYAPVWSCAVWLWPWLADARQRQLRG